MCIYTFTVLHMCLVGRAEPLNEATPPPPPKGGVWQCPRPLFLHLGGSAKEVSDLTVSLLERRWGGGRGAVVAMRSCGHQLVCKNNTSLLSIRVDLTTGSSVYIA